MTVHHTGNPGREARLGGLPGRLSVSNPILSTLLLRAIHEEAKGLEGFYVGFEATHHGPTELSNPLTFVEIGSGPAEWNMERLHDLMARAIVRAIEEALSKPPSCPVAASFGENHYPSRVSRRAIEGNFCVGHVIPKYVVSEVTEYTVVQALERSSALVDVVLVEEGSLPRTVRSLVESVASRRKLRVEHY